MGNVSLTFESKCIFIIQSVLFIISYILLLLFRSIYFLFVMTLVTEMHFLLQKNLKNIMHGPVKMYAMR